MPELPEVETVRSILAKRIVNKTIKKINVFYPKTIRGDSKKFANSLINQTINDVKRRGKWLIFELDDYYLLSHLRMEGKYLYRTKGDLVNKHEHVAFIFDDNSELRYHDTRKFGRMELIKKNSNDLNRYLKNLGPEPAAVKFDYLKQKYQNKQVAIKTALLDQSIFVGVGNIYADEILFLSRINPLKKAGDLSENEIKQIIENSQKVLNKAILLGGTTINTYTPEEGVSGRFQNELLVHAKKNQKCPTCLNNISKMKVNGRGTYFCPQCQKK